MTQELAETIVQAIEAEGRNAKIRLNYSGRGMYGKETCGVIYEGTMGGILECILANAGFFVNNACDSLFDEAINHDSMGTDIIIY